MKEAERVAKTYDQFYHLFVQLVAQLIGWQQKFDSKTLIEFKRASKKVDRINKRYVRR